MKNMGWMWGYGVKALTAIAFALMVFSSANGGLREQYGDGAWHDIGSGWQYRYVSSIDSGYWLNSGVTRFGFSYSPGQWWHHGTTWTPLSGGGLTEGDWVGDGAWHSNLVSGWSYRYVASISSGYWNTGSATRFGYDYRSGQWWDCRTQWLPLGGSGVSEQFVGDGAWHSNMVSGWLYRYVKSISSGYWNNGSATRFGYDYNAGQWWDCRTQWLPLGVSGLSQAFVGDGAWHSGLVNGWSYRYVTSISSGYWNTGGATRFGYDYRAGQWWDLCASAWHKLGNAALSQAFLGDGTYRALGQGFDYMYSADSGYFRYDTGHHFKQSYADGSWQYLHNGNVWSTWNAATPFQDMTTDSLSAADDFVVWNGSLYFTNLLHLYCFDGTSVNEVALAAANQLVAIDFLAANSAGLFFNAAIFDSTRGFNIYHLFRWTGPGTSFLQDESSDIDFTSPLSYLGAISSCLYFAGEGPTFLKDIYRWHDPGTGQDIFANISNGNFGSYSFNFLDIIGTDIFFSGYHASDRVNLYKVAWDGNAAAMAAYVNAHYMFSLTKADDHFYAWVQLGTCSADYYWDVYKWNGTSFYSVAGHYYAPGDYYNPRIGFEVGASLYFIAKASASSYFDLYGLNSTTLQNITNQYFSSLDLTAPWGNYLYFSGIPAYQSSSNIWSLYRATWAPTMFSYAQISGTVAPAGFTEAVESLGSAGSNLYVAGKDGDGIEIYKCGDAVAFTEVSNNSNFGFVQFLGSSGADVYFRAGFATTGSPWEVYELSGATFAAATNSGFVDASDIDYVWYQGDLFFMAYHGYSIPYYNSPQPWHFWTEYVVLSQR